MLRGSRVQAVRFRRFGNPKRLLSLFSGAKSVFDRLKLYEWTFSATAEAVVGVLLILAILLAVTAFA
jgi:hypothetical protein